MRIPAAERITKAEDALLGAGLLLVAPGAAEEGIELPRGDGVEQGHRLQPVARLAARPVDVADPAGGDRLGDAAHDEPGPELLDAGVAEGDRLGEVVTGVDVQQRETAAEPARTPSRRGAA